jgi:alkanesulfonate monooxygenase SsuD/methylene tetrahydromethanopterin reductase-like flavin-dependent oxidoreductase (luciferase family)
VPSSRRQPGIGLYLPIRESRGSSHHADVTRSWPDLLRLARLSEDAGFDAVWVPDHLLFRWPGEDDRPQGTWECWSILSALAARTTRLSLGTLVACTSFRHPALLAKMAETVDEISSGRLVLGLGAGYHEPEFRAFGYRFEDRASRFEEDVTVIRELLSRGRSDFSGRHQRLEGAVLRPRGPRPDGLPIMIATSNPQGALRPRMHRILAERADFWNGWLAFWRSWPDAIPPLRAHIDAACWAAGRDPVTLSRTVTILVRFPDLDPAPLPGGVEPLTGTPAELASAFAGFAAEGISHLQLQLDPCTPAAIERIGLAIALART